MNTKELIWKELGKYDENEMIFVSKLYKEKLFNSDISEASFYKALERMYKNKELEKLSKGIYYIPKTSKFGVAPISNEQIINLFIKKDEGMVVGYDLYNKLNLTTQISKKIIIYSSNVDNDTKNIRNIEIRNIKLKFTQQNRNIIEMLEVLQNFNLIQDINYCEFYNYAKRFSQNYNEKILNKVLMNISYKKSTISFLNNILDYFEVENNLKRHLSSLSKYNHLSMEEIYEFARAQRRF